MCESMKRQIIYFWNINSQCHTPDKGEKLLHWFFYLIWIHFPIFTNLAATLTESDCVWKKRWCFSHLQVNSALLFFLFLYFFFHSLIFIVGSGFFLGGGFNTLSNHQLFYVGFILNLSFLSRKQNVSWKQKLF